MQRSHRTCHGKRERKTFISEQSLGHKKPENRTRTVPVHTINQTTPSMEDYINVWILFGPPGIGKRTWVDTYLPGNVECVSRSQKPFKAAFAFQETETVDIRFANAFAFTTARAQNPHEALIRAAASIRRIWSPHLRAHVIEFICEDSCPVLHMTNVSIPRL